MPDIETKPCPACNHANELDAAFCSACGKPQEKPDAPTEGAAHTSFELADDPTPTPSRSARPRPAPPPPAPMPEQEAPAPAATGDDEPHIIELEDLEDEASETPSRSQVLDKDDDEGGGDTVRMPLSEVVKAWTEEAPDEPSPEADAAEVVVPANLMRKPILILVGIVVLIVLAIVLL